MFFIDTAEKVIVDAASVHGSVWVMKQIEERETPFWRIIQFINNAEV